MTLLSDAANRKSNFGKAGRAAEKKTLSAHGAQPTPNSGASSAKGDGVLPEFRMEVKSTTRESFSLKRQDLSKITGEAHATGLTPCLAIVFTDGSGRPVREGSWVCIPQDTFKELTDGD